MEIGIVMLVFAAAAALMGAIGSFTTASPTRRRLVELSAGLTTTADSKGGGRSIENDRPGILERIMSRLARAAPSHGAPAKRLLHTRLVRAGYRSESAAVFYMGARVALALLLPTLLLFTQIVWQVSETRLVLLLIASSALGYVIPSYWLDKRVAARQKQILHGLPDSLDLMVVCVEAGLGINASLARVAVEFARTNPVLKEELELVTLEIRAGKSLTDALRGLSDRTGLSEVSSLVAMLVQTEQFGTSVANALRVHAEGVRVERMQRAEENAAKAPVKMLFPTLLIFVATLIVVLGPGFVQLLGVFRDS